VEDHFFPQAKLMIYQLAGLDALSNEELRHVCSYILWAIDANITLTFTPSFDEVAMCSTIGDARFYGVSYGIQELWHLGAYEFL
jgi:hypothetical protein